MLVGADFAGGLFTGKIKRISEGLVAMHTRLGWTVMGKTGEKTRNCNALLSLHVSDLNIPDLWKLDTIGIRDSGENPSKKELEEAAKLHFLENVKRDEEGRYILSLPWIKDHPPLSSCKKIAEKRIANCVKSLEKIRKLQDYEEVFKDWVKEGIIERVESSREVEREQHYLPHRPVFKENSTTRVRPVFDGSARENNFPSINDCLEKGPNLIELIPSIINRFRYGKYGVVSDIKKAFLQIGLQERDRPFLRFIWWEKGKKENLTIYQHKRVVFGISSSPFLLAATLELHLKNTPKHLQETAQKLMKSFYVDNCVCSLDSPDQLKQFISESQLILESGKFELRGWEHSPISSTTERTKENDKVTVLGMNWNPATDMLSVDLKNLLKEEKLPITKRKILSAVHRIFDPIGITCPVTLEPKILLQECWKSKFTWDEEVPPEVKKKFERWKTSLSSLNELSFPRYLREGSEFTTKLSLHIFCDSSKAAFATCIFLRTESTNATTCQLIQARNRVAPLKRLSIPRLELLSCTIGARLAKTTIADLGLEHIPTLFWSDSTNALYWIKKNENWSTFVYNRVQEIRRLTNPEDWNHVRTESNAADLPSRGCNAKELIKSRWWEGPDWLRQSSDDWSLSDAMPDMGIVNSEKKKSVMSATNVEAKDLDFFIKISSYKKLIRTAAWILRFSSNSKKKREERKLNSLELKELNKAEKIILKEVQKQCFKDNIRNLQTFLDTDGLLRV